MLTLYSVRPQNTVRAGPRYGATGLPSPPRALGGTAQCLCLRFRLRHTAAALRSSVALYGAMAWLLRPPGSVCRGLLALAALSLVRSVGPLRPKKTELRCSKP